MLSPLGVFDFDGTAFDTFAPPPGGIGVKEAYELAVEELFGVRGLQFYRDAGGLQNRSPREVVTDIVMRYGEGREGLFTHLLHFLRDNGGRMRAFTTTKKLESSFTRATVYPIVAEMLVCLKLERLMNQIGTPMEDGALWPPPVFGFIEYWRKIVSMQGMRTLIISSGHEGFITKVFKLYDLPLPDTMVTDDDTRHLSIPMSKPDEGLVSLGLNRLSIDPSDLEIALFGDDPNKDGKLASNAGVPFYLVDPSGKYLGHPRRFKDWTEVPWPKLD